MSLLAAASAKRHLRLTWADDDPFYADEREDLALKQAAAEAAILQFVGRSEAGRVHTVAWLTPETTPLDVQQATLILIGEFWRFRGDDPGAVMTSQGRRGDEDFPPAAIGLLRRVLGSGARMIANGDRTRKISLDNPGDSVPDGDGGYIEGWEPLSPPTMWARVNPATQQDLERSAAGTVLSSQAFLIETPYHRQVSVLTRIQMPDPDRGLRTFQVKSVRNPDEARRELVIVAEEIIGSDAAP